MFLPIIGESALCFWLNGNNVKRLNQYSLQRRTLTALPEYYEYRPTRDLASLIAKAFDLPLPVHFMAPSPKMRIQNEFIHSTVQMKGLPSDAFIEIGRFPCQTDTGQNQICHVLIACPELCFLQAGVRMSRYALIKLGYDLCSIYAKSSSQFGQTDRLAATSVLSIHSFITGLHDCRGIKNCRSAVTHLLDHSRSPQETANAMLTTLPIYMGGYAVKKPVLNYNVSLCEEGTRLLGRNYCCCDMFWPTDWVAVEYDSNETHLNPRQHAVDKARANALSLSGCRLLTVTAASLSSLENADRTFFTLRHMLKMQRRSKEFLAFREVRRELLDFLHSI